MPRPCGRTAADRPTLLQASNTCCPPDHWRSNNGCAPCPKFNGTVCAGHGQCNSVGACTCDTGYTGDLCNVTCTGNIPASGPFTAVCSGHGLCQDPSGACVCETGWALVTCAAECPGGAGRVCSGHGACDHATAQCVCHNDNARGHFANVLRQDCSECVPGYFGALCNTTCQADPQGQTCSGHGACVLPDANALPQCQCFASDLQGHWNGSTCGDCQPGYYGPLCRQQCKGGACNPCSGHGACSDGVNGTGFCACASAVWSQEVHCNDCVAGRYGADCLGRCPGHHLLCFGHGACSQGVMGTGACTCDPDGHWDARLSCADCTTGYWGELCTRVCPGTLVENTCNVQAHADNLCEDGVNGTGACRCAANLYLGPQCQYLCPYSAGAGGAWAGCSGHGTCALVAGTNTTQCTCDARWTGAECAACAYGFAGSSCAIACAANAAGEICSGASQGTARGGRNATECFCECRPGWAGAACDVPCKGGVQTPCSGNGLCDAETGLCTCTATAAGGFWAGEACDVCQTGYIGADCKLKCPANATAHVCSGHGTCHVSADTGAAVCICDRYCGTACDQQDLGDTCRCPESYRYGVGCVNNCPGTTAGSPPQPCSGHGVCENMRTAIVGQCYCAVGYRGAGCMDVCPGIIDANTSSPRVCAGHGTCDYTAGAATALACACAPGYWGADCAGRCPPDPQNPCSGHGSCGLADGLCSCEAAWKGAACDQPCPETPAGLVCNGAARGTCVLDNATLTAACVCARGATEGYWAGRACADCLSGWSGADCTVPCVNGNTSGHLCACFEGWWGPSCTQECPGGANYSCSTHGTCDIASGLCACDASWFTDSCAVNCTPANCRVVAPELEFPMCSAGGNCVVCCSVLACGAPVRLHARLGLPSVLGGRAGPVQCFVILKVQGDRQCVQRGVSHTAVPCGCAF